MYKLGTENLQNTGSQSRPSTYKVFFSDTLIQRISVAFKLTRNGQKYCLERIHLPKPKERKFVIMKI